MTAGAPENRTCDRTTLVYCCCCGYVNGTTAPPSYCPRCGKKWGDCE
jgi:hypothetical protein